MRKSRSAARELALNILYQWDCAGVPFEEALETAMEFVDLGGPEEKNSEKGRQTLEYARLLATGAREHLNELDGFIAELAHGWPLDRQPAVDRNILRIAIYEIRHVDSVPPVVAVDEAVELAKKFSTEDSGKFVNGVLAGYLRKYEQRPEGNEIAGKDS